MLVLKYLFTKNIYIDVNKSVLQIWELAIFVVAVLVDNELVSKVKMLATYFLSNLDKHISFLQTVSFTFQTVRSPNRLGLSQCHHFILQKNTLI